MNIYEKIFKAKQEIGVIQKKNENPFFKSKYFDINELLKQVEPVLTKYNLLLTQPLKDGFVYSIITDVETGEQLESFIKLPDINDPQKMGIAITYYRRYTANSLLSLQSEDDDGNGAQITKVTNNQISFILDLLITSTLEDRMKDDIRNELDHFSYERAEKCISYLKDNQADSVNPSKKEINNLVQTKIDLDK